MTWQVLTGDCRDVLAGLPERSVHTVVTSPPYFGLRDYGMGEWEGGDPDCDHAPPPSRASASSTLKNDGRPNPGAKAYEVATPTPYRDACGKCGASRVDRQIGLEPTPDEFVQALVDVFREVRRVLRDDGTVWLNLGDSYLSNWGLGAKRASSWWSTRNGELEGKGWGDVETHIPANEMRKRVRDQGIKVKDLIGIPWMVAFALRADGWYLRSDIIWSKPNPMPESVTDRPTKAHEYVFLLSKQPRYYYDSDAVREPHITGERNGERVSYPAGSSSSHNLDTGGHIVGRHGPGLPLNEAGRNKRSVWSVATQPFSGAHFATFPPKLIEPCILAGCPEGGTVLDPFAGAGTTGMVALRHGRSFVGVELNPEYAQMARDRIIADCPLHNYGLEVA